MCHLLVTYLDFQDLHMRLRLSMTPALSLVLLGFIVEAVDLFGFLVDHLLEVIGGFEQLHQY